LALDKLDQCDHGRLSIVALLLAGTRDCFSSAAFRVCDWRGDAKEWRRDKTGPGTNVISAFHVQ
jgi:hypothetical protein